MVNATSLPARILANLAIWGILFLGAFFLLTFKDYTMGLELAVLTSGKLPDPFLRYDTAAHVISPCDRPDGDADYCISMDLRLGDLWLFDPVDNDRWHTRSIGRWSEETD